MSFTKLIPEVTDDHKQLIFLFSVENCSLKLHNRKYIYVFHSVQIQKYSLIRIQRK